MTVKLFLEILDMSGNASWMILCVLAVRFLMRKLPKKYAYALWMVIWIRLLCPFTFETQFSPVPYSEPLSVYYEETAETEFRPAAVSVPSYEAEVPVINETNTRTWRNLVYPGSLIWLAGIVCFTVCSGVSLHRLKQKLRFSVAEAEDIRRCDYIESPFVYGIVKPVIYLPSSLSEQECGYILMHERFHIRRKDPLVKLVSYLALVLHWFNPLVWLAYDCFQKDMEMSCDEEVVCRNREDIRPAYAESLLSLSVQKHRYAAPVAFTEGDPKLRIANLAVKKNRKKTAGIIAASVCLILAMVFMMTRQKESTPAVKEDVLYVSGEEVSEITLWYAPGGIAEENRHVPDPERLIREINENLKEITKVSDQTGIGAEDAADIVYILEIKGTVHQEILTVIHSDSGDILVNDTGKYAVNAEVYLVIDEAYDAIRTADHQESIPPAEDGTVMDAFFVADLAEIPGMNGSYDMCDAAALIRVETIKGAETYSESTEKAAAPFTWGTFTVLRTYKGDFEAEKKEYTFTRGGGTVPWSAYRTFMQEFSPDSLAKSEALMKENQKEPPAYVHWRESEDIDIESGKTYLAFFNNTDYPPGKIGAWNIAWRQAGLREVQGTQVLNNMTGAWEELDTVVSEIH